VIDPVLGFDVRYSKISNLPKFTSMQPKSKQENSSDKHWTTSLHIHQTWW